MKSVRRAILKFTSASSSAKVLVVVVVLSILALVIDASRAPKSNGRLFQRTPSPLTAVSPAQPITEAEAKSLPDKSVVSGSRYAMSV